MTERGRDADRHPSVKGDRNRRPTYAPAAPRVIRLLLAATILLILFAVNRHENYLRRLWGCRGDAFAVLQRLATDLSPSHREARVSALHKPASDVSVQTAAPYRATGIAIFTPHSRTCRGDFVYRNASEVSSRKHAAPTLMLREAAVDYRHNSVRDFLIKHHLVDVPFRRVTLQVSAARGLIAVQPVSKIEQPESSGKGDFPSSFLFSMLSDGRKEEVADWRSEIEYIHGDPNCVNKCFMADHIKQICAGQEWQLVVNIVGPPDLRTESEFDAALNQLDKRFPGSTFLAVNLPAKYSNDGEPIKGKLTISLSCISGLLRIPEVPSLSEILPGLPSRRVACEKSMGSVVAAGGAMFGYKRNNPEGRKEAANFAARSLLGSVRFDTVAVSVIANYSVSEIYSKCGDDQKCAAEYHERNDRYMAQLAGDIEGELRVLGVPESYWSRVLLFPMCRLGTDFNAYEPNGHGCKWSAFYGQWITNDHSYTLLSPYHKWFASFDLDEFVVDDTAFLASTHKPDMHVLPKSATVLFNEREQDSGVKGILRVPWLDFMQFRDQTRNVTKAVLKSGGLEMVSTSRGKGGPLDRSSCIPARTRGGVGGKPILACSNGGIGIHVHDALHMTKADDMRTRQCVKRVPFESNLALYHGHAPRFGDCTFPRGDVM